MSVNAEKTQKSTGLVTKPHLNTLKKQSNQSIKACFVKVILDSVDSADTEIQR